MDVWECACPAPAPPHPHPLLQPLPCPCFSGIPLSLHPRVLGCCPSSSLAWHPEPSSAPCHWTALCHCGAILHGVHGLVTHPSARSPLCQIDSHAQSFQKRIREKLIRLISYRKFCFQLIKRCSRCSLQ